MAAILSGVVAPLKLKSFERNHVDSVEEIAAFSHQW
jgi:hypothetical protein